MPYTHSACVAVSASGDTTLVVCCTGIQASMDVGTAVAPHSRLTVMVAALLAAALPVAADVNLLANPTLDEALTGWVGHERTELTWDGEKGKTGAGSMMLPGLGGRQAAFQDVVLDRPANLLDFSGWCLCGAVDGSALVALDMGVTLDDGQTVWFVPPPAKLAQGRLTGSI